MNSNLFIRTYGEMFKNPDNFQNNTSNFFSMAKEKSLTTNDSATAFTSKFNTISGNPFRRKRGLKKPFIKSKTNSKYSTLNIFGGINENNNFLNNKHFLPNITSRNQIRKFLIDNADEILKERRRHYMGRRLKQTKSSILEKSKEICLNNFLITQLKEKRTEINNKQMEIISNLKGGERKFDLDYKNFIDFVENINKKEKQEEDNLNKIKNISKYLETKLKEQINLNKNLEMKNESLIKQIILLQSYGSFLHKIFYKPFTFDKLKIGNLKRKKYLYLTDEIISLYEESQNNKAQEDISYIIKNDEILMDKYTFLEQKVLKIIEEKQTLNQELNSMKKNYKIALDQLLERKEDCQKEYSKFKQEKREVNNIMKDYIKIDSDNIGEIEEYMNYLIEIGKEVGFEINNFNNKQNSKIIDSSQICKEIMNILEEKEYLMNTNIKFIENTIKNGNKKDKELIENLIYQRKVFNKNEKQEVLRKIKENKEISNRLKTIEKAKRIYLKGRKVFPVIPIFKNKNKKFKKGIKNQSDFEYLNYSSDE